MTKLVFYLFIALAALIITANCALPVECELPPFPGPCKGMFPSFYYNPSTKQCESFIYGGCKGNANRFESVEKCLANCGEQAREDVDI